MLRKLLPALLLAVSAWWSAGQAQAQRQAHPEHTFGFRCSFDSVQQAEWQRHPGAEAEYRRFLRSVAEMAPAEQARLRALPDVTVPVVVHIIHTGGANNISDAQVYDAIRILNEDFNKLNRDTADVIAAFQPIYARVGFQFRLARKDPNGNCTTGITRTYSTQTTVGDNSVKDVIRWDQNRYVNIWVTDRANGAGGYAILPCGGGLYDGIVILNTQFASIGRSCGSNFCARSLTHEMGHHFGLPHVWGGSNTPGLASNCGLDDGIADTPNTTGVGAPAGGSGCPLTSAPCGVLANVQNYMDYASCIKMFTEGQKAVMRSALNLPCRATLVSQANLVATGTNDGYVPVPCTPTIAFRASVNTICQGGSVSFTDYSYNADLTGAQYQWSFPGGTPSSASTRTASVTYNTPGVYDVTLTVTTAAGASTTETRQQVVRVLGAAAAFSAPYVETFANPTWPTNPTDPDKSWRVESNVPAASKWARISGIGSPLQGGTDDSSIRLSLGSNSLPDGTITTLYSPIINLAATPTSGTYEVAFDRAYARRNSASADQLRIYFSGDCGQSWTSPATVNAASLVSNGGAYVVGSFFPQASQWAVTSLAIPTALQSATRLIVRIDVTSNGGNFLYLDNFRVADPTVAATHAADMATRNIGVFPNPLSQETAVHFRLDQPTTAQVQVLDLLGRSVLTTKAQHFGAGQQQIPLQAAGKHLSAGVYVVQLTLGQQRYTTRVVVQ
ncbi:T9SS type A sorting domain-containing protein [Hymenobacter busanensis]|uniref:T9SS type A sorting domain-containing protein n=1 Tax=Hymenobacter busanensis TaxID=2607656 RepID=A0A7L4ZSL2_9BACT|nr:M43 family zinc metalloprotease [Hymenobacter busanensis]KAA9325846.1 T9SS type A sorting domain-containing protein [Hymenobacter busanensis]QHJ06314.1 T9SS type A sorting domain-containing protein [Hymenobacter busanensis]